MEKCKVCGSRVGDSESKCPVCGSVISDIHKSVNINSVNSNSVSQHSIDSESISSRGCNSPVCQISSKPTQSPNLVSESRDATDSELEDAYITGKVGVPFRNPAYIHYKSNFEKFENGQEATFSYRYGTLVNLPYRKHYVRAFFLGLVFWILWIPMCITRSRRNRMIYAAGVGATLATPMINNDWYIFNRYKKVAYKALRKFPGDSARQLAYVAEKGGTNFLAAFIFVLFISIPLFVFIYFCYLLFAEGAC